MYILGISCYYHDSAAALLKDGMLVAAADEERFTRKKHDYSFPHLAIEFCLQQAEITSHDLDYVVFYEKPLLKFERILMSTLGTFPKSTLLMACGKCRFVKNNSMSITRLGHPFGLPHTAQPRIQRLFLLQERTA